MNLLELKFSGIFVCKLLNCWMQNIKTDVKTHIKLITRPHAAPVLHACPWVLIKIWQAHSAVLKIRLT